MTVDKKRTNLNFSGKKTKVLVFFRFSFLKKLVFSFFQKFLKFIEIKIVKKKCVSFTEHDSAELFFSRVSDYKVLYLLMSHESCTKFTPVYRDSREQTNLVQMSFWHFSYCMPLPTILFIPVLLAEDFVQTVVRLFGKELQ